MCRSASIANVTVPAVGDAAPMPLEARVRGHQFCARDLRAERRLGSPSTPASSGACSLEVPALDRPFGGSVHGVVRARSETPVAAGV